MAKTKTKKQVKKRTTFAKTSANAVVELGEIKLSSIQLSNRFNRESIDTKSEAFRGLVASVKASGVIQPILLRNVNGNGTYELIAGERRYRAAKAAKLKTVPAVVRKADDLEAGTLQLAENVWREDLTPFEEALQLKRQVDAGISTGDLAKQLGKTRRHVQRRMSISNLSDPWKAALRDEKFNIKDWPAMLLERVAKLPDHVQNALLTEIDQDGIQGADESGDAGPRSTDHVPTVADLDRIVGGITRELRRAQWKRDDAELVPDAGACADCPKRGAHNPDLWDGLAEAKTKDEIQQRDICLDTQCWEAKTRAHVKAKARELEMKHGIVPVKISESWSSDDPEAVHKYHVTECKKTAKDSRPAIQIDGKGAGRTCWVQAQSPKSSSATSSSSTKPTQKRPLSERKAELHQKRAKVVYTQLDFALGQTQLDQVVEALEPHPNLAGNSLATRVLMSLVTCFGTHSHFRSVDDDATWTAFDGLRETKDESKIHVHLWQDVRDTLQGVLRRSFCSNILEDPVQFQEDAERIAGIIGLDVATYWSEAEKKYPTPSTWAKEEAEAAMGLKKAEAK